MAVYAVVILLTLIVCYSPGHGWFFGSKVVEKTDKPSSENSGSVGLKADEKTDELSSGNSGGIGSKADEKADKPSSDNPGWLGSITHASSELASNTMSAVGNQMTMKNVQALAGNKMVQSFALAVLPPPIGAAIQFAQSDYGQALINSGLVQNAVSKTLGRSPSPVVDAVVKDANGGSNIIGCGDLEAKGTTKGDKNAEEKGDAEVEENVEEEEENVEEEGIVEEGNNAAGDDSPDDKEAGEGDGSGEGDSKLKGVEEVQDPLEKSKSSAIKTIEID